MLEAVVFTYSMLVTFVMNSVTRNRRANRQTAPVIEMIGWMLVAVSMTLPMLIGAAYLYGSLTA